MEKENVKGLRELRYLKKHYGEKFAKFARANFSTILEKEGTLTNIIEEYFAHSHSLFEDVLNENVEADFVKFVYSKYKGINVDYYFPSGGKTPEELLSQAGYILFPECQTEKDLEQFKKYYYKDELICTLWPEANRLSSNRVWFAVKKNVDEIKREDFKKPYRQDKYGTSVISIQFDKGEMTRVSIKNRYNHTVINPDATFSNNLDNIIPGLTNAFCEKYGIYLDENITYSLSLQNYTRLNGKKFYRYNVFDIISNITFCENNIMLSRFQEVKFDKSRYLLVDNYLIDFVKKEVYLVYDEKTLIKDAFTKSIGQIKTIHVENTPDGKKIVFGVQDGEDVILNIDSNNSLRSYCNNNVTEIDNNFLGLDNNIESIEMKKVKTVERGFLQKNKCLTTLNMPELRTTKEDFLSLNKDLANLDLPNLEYLADNSFNCLNIKNVFLPKLKIMSKNCFLDCKAEVVDLPMIEYIGPGCFDSFDSYDMVYFNVPNLTYIGDRSFYSVNSCDIVNAPSIKDFGTGVFHNNEIILQLFAETMLKNIEKDEKKHEMIKHNQTDDLLQK